MTPRRLPALYRRIMFVSIALLLAFCCLQAHFHNERERAQAALLAQTRERIVREIEPLCRALIPAEDTLAFHLAPMQMYDGSSGERNHYSVECLDARGEQRLHLLWDEDARRPYSISVVPNGAHSHSARLKNIAAGQSVGSAWMCRLGLVGAQEAGASRARVESFASVEVTRLYLAGRMAMAWTDRRSGELRQITVYQHSTAPQLQALQTPRPAAPPHT